MIPRFNVSTYFEVKKDSILYDEEVEDFEKCRDLLKKNKDSGRKKYSIVKVGNLFSIVRLAWFRTEDLKTFFWIKQKYFLK